MDDYIEIEIDNGKGGYLVPDTTEGRRRAEELMEETDTRLMEEEDRSLIREELRLMMENQLPLARRLCDDGVDGG